MYRFSDLMSTLQEWQVTGNLHAQTLREVNESSSESPVGHRSLAESLEVVLFRGRHLDVEEGDEVKRDFRSLCCSRGAGCAGTWTAGGCTGGEEFSKGALYLLVRNS